MSSSESDDDPIIRFKVQPRYTSLDYREKLSLKADEVRRMRELYNSIEKERLLTSSNIVLLSHLQLQNMIEDEDSSDDSMMSGYYNSSSDSSTCSDSNSYSSSSSNCSSSSSISSTSSCISSTLSCISLTLSCIFSSSLLSNCSTSSFDSVVKEKRKRTKPRMKTKQDDDSDSDSDDDSFHLLRQNLHLDAATMSNNNHNTCITNLVCLTAIQQSEWDDVVIST